MRPVPTCRAISHNGDFMPDWTSIADIPWLNAGEPAGAPALRGAQAGAAIASVWQRRSAMNEERRQFDINAAMREQEFATQQKLQDVQLETAIINNVTKQNMVDDAATLTADIAAINAIHEPDALRTFASNREYKTTQGRQSLQSYLTDRIAQLSNTQARQAEALVFSDLASRYAKLPPEGMIEVRAAFGEKEKWNANSLSVLGKWEEAEKEKAFKREKELKSIAPTIAAQSRESVASINAQGRIDAAIIKSDADLDEAAHKLEIDAKKLLQKVDYQAYLQKAIAIRTDDDLDLKGKILRLNALSDGFNPATVKPATNAPTAPATTKPKAVLTSEDKAALAMRLRSQNPTWTREQIIEAVNQNQ